nr:hypothetical protein CFP56_29453 [Quercus suber]
MLDGSFVPLFCSFQASLSEEESSFKEKKAKGGTVSGLLSKKKTGDVSKKESVTSVPPSHLPVKRPTSPTSSLEMVAFGGEEIKKKKKASGKSFLPTFWDDADVAALKAHKALFVDDLNPLMAKSSGEALGESLFLFGKLLDLEKKVATFEPLFKSFSTENEMLKNKVSILTTEAENDKQCVVALEKSLQVEKDFYSNEYSDELCKYYVEGFDLLVKWIAKHHPGLDFSGLAVDNVKKELLSAEATSKNVTEEAIEVAKGMKEATVITPADPAPDEQ